MLIRVNSNQLIALRARGCGSLNFGGEKRMVILKGIPRILSPQLLNVLARMGHGDEIVLADINFPAASVCRWVWSNYTIISGCVVLFP